MDSFTTEAFTLLGVGISIIGLRLYARITTVGFSRLQADDALMVLAAIVYSVETALAYSVGAYWKGLANNAMTDEQRRLLDPSSEEYILRVNGSKTQVAGWSTYTLLLWIIKAAMCTFYLRLTEGLEFRSRIHVGFGLIAVTWLAVLLSILLSCVPLHKNWQIYPDPGNFCQPAISKIDIFVTVVLNVVTDLYLLTIPIPMLWKAALRPAKKAGLILLFSGGLFVTMAGILRCVLILTDPVNGAQMAGSWAVRETFVAVITSNIPMIVPLISRWARPVLGSLRSLTSHVGKASGLSRSADSRGPGVFRLEDKNPRRGMGPRSIHPITGLSFDGSQERIYPDQQTNEHDRRPTALSDLDQEGFGTSAAPSPTSGGILKETSLQVTETRHTVSDENIGDYYLVMQQSSRTASGEIAIVQGHGHKKGKHSGLHFGIAR
ncbi:hypothetical protein V8F06_013265 [Rhypophila decipiens]